MKASHICLFLAIFVMLQLPRLAVATQPNDALNEVFVVRNVKIVADSIDTDNARTDAINKGLIDSFKVLLKRILAPNDIWRVDSIKFEDGASALTKMVTHTEKMTSNSYEAKVDYYFNEEVIKSVLYSQGVFFMNKYTKEKLVIPVLCLANECSTDDDSKWYSAWSNLPGERGLVRFKYLLNDLQDEALLDPNKLLDVQRQGLEGLGKRYMVSEYILILGRCATDCSKMDVTFRSISPKDDEAKTMKYEMRKAETLPDFYERIANDMLDLADYYYKHYDEFK